MYIPISWLGFGVRYDQVHPDWEDRIERHVSTDGDRNHRNRTFHSVSPKLKLKTNFITHEEVTLQYTRYFFAGQNGRDIEAQHPYEASTPIDKNVLQLQVTMWW
jgi:hypothetical protein